MNFSVGILLEFKIYARSSSSSTTKQFLPLVKGVFTLSTHLLFNTRTFPWWIASKKVYHIVIYLILKSIRNLNKLQKLHFDFKDNIIGNKIIW